MSETKPGNEELLAEARRNIERHRKADLTVEAVGADGRPAAGVRVAVRMRRHAFLFGCALFEALADRGEQFARQKPLKAIDHWDDLRRQAVELFNACTLPVYWGGYEAEPGRTRVNEVRQLREWAVSQGMRTKAHPIVWCQAVPDWLPEDRGELQRTMERRLAGLVEAFGPRSATPLDFVDFLNEPTVQPQNFENPLALWMRDLGPTGTAEMAWDLCRGFDLPARGILNHFMRDQEFLDAARQLIDGGRAIRAIGLQSHQHSGTRPLWMFQEETDLFADALGVPVHWTENSVLSGENRRIRFIQGKAEVPPWPSTPEGEAEQAEALAGQYTLLFGHPRVESLVQWNFSDANSWLGAPSGLLDADLRPKPAYLALRKLIRDDWWTEAELVTDRDGRATVRAFHGDYDIRVESPGGAVRPSATVAGRATTVRVALGGA